MIQMADDQFFVAALNQQIKERDRITSARDANEIAPVRRDRAKNIFILNPIQRDLTSNVRR
jgi:hypothetical protein